MVDSSVVVRSPGRVDDLLGRLDVGLRDGLVPSEIFNDVELHALELERIFGRAWCFIGHVSEIPSPGDYRLRYIAQDAFIFIRDEHGEVRVLWDACRHRGQKVCRAEAGNTSHFRCSYHGWTYSNSGAFVAAPDVNNVYPGLEKDRWGLLSPAQVDSYCGYVFASMDPDAPSLSDYLADFKYYLDIMGAFSPDYWQPVTDGQHWVNDGNWKSGVENACGDDYHLITLHRSAFLSGLMQSTDAISARLGYQPEDVVHLQLGNGHTMTVFLSPGRVRTLPDSAKERLTPDQIELAERMRYMLGIVFPTGLFGSSPLPNGDTSMYCGVMAPRAASNAGLPHQMEQWRWNFAKADYSWDDRVETYQAFLARGGAAGTITQDDPEPWAAISRTGGSVMSRKLQHSLNFQMGLGKTGPSDQIEWSLPGIAIKPAFEEAGQRAFYRHYHHFMTSAAYPRIISSEEQGLTALGRREPWDNTNG